MAAYEKFFVEHSSEECAVWAMADKEAVLTGDEGDSIEPGMAAATDSTVKVVDDEFLVEKSGVDSALGAITGEEVVVELTGEES